MDNENTDIPSTPRENLIATAVKFLQNPKVTESPPSQKRTFLEKKGLTKEEIDIAFSQAGVNENEVSGSSNPITPSIGQVQPYIQPAPPVSSWNKYRDYTATTIVAGGFLYGIYIIYKKYLMPFWYGPSQEERQLQAIQKSIADLHENIKETLASIRDMQGTVSNQQRQIENLSPTGAYKNTQEERLVNEVKDEIKSLKGLLLSRKQFPPTPNTQPVLPAWQLAASTKSDKDTAPETNTSTIISSETSSMELIETPHTSTVNSTEPNGTEPSETPSQEAASNATTPPNVNDTGSEVYNSVSLLEQEDVPQNFLNGHLTNGDLDSGDSEEGQSSQDTTSSKLTPATMVTKAEVLQPSQETITA